MAKRFIPSLLLAIMIMACQNEPSSEVNALPSDADPIEEVQAETITQPETDENRIVSRKKLQPNQIPQAVKANIPNHFPNKPVINRSLLLTYADGSTLYMFAIEHDGERVKVLFDELGNYKGLFEE